MKLFRAIVMNVWQERQGTTGSLVADLSKKLGELQRREGLLDEAYLYDKRIDRPTYERQRDKLREEIALARIELDDARLEEIDVEGVLAFAEHVLTNAARLWVEASPEQKTRLQRALFPDGLQLKDGKFGTATTCFAFTQLAAVASADSDVASPSGSDTQGNPVPPDIPRGLTAVPRRVPSRVSGCRWRASMTSARPERGTIDPCARLRTPRQWWNTPSMCS
jgi:hypothetical protein